MEFSKRILCFWAKKVETFLNCVVGLSLLETVTEAKCFYCRLPEPWLLIVQPFF